MARRNRVKAEGLDAAYHVYNRVNGTKDWHPFEELWARVLFLRLLWSLLAVYCIELMAMALMGNHFHLELWVRKRVKLDREELERRAALLWPDPRRRPKTERQWEKFEARLFDLSAFMKDLQGRFTREFNKRTGRRGSLWAGRFRSTLLGEEAIVPCAHYIEFNPCAAHLVEKPGEWPWSSARAREQRSDDWLVPLTQLMGRRDPEAAFRDYMESRNRYAQRRWSKEMSWAWIQGRAIGSADFVARFAGAGCKQGPMPLGEGDLQCLQWVRLPKEVVPKTLHRTTSQLLSTLPPQFRRLVAG